MSTVASSSETAARASGRPRGAEGRSALIVTKTPEQVDKMAAAGEILVKTMASEGFSPYGQAWWHFNYPLEGAVPLDQVIR